RFQGRIRSQLYKWNGKKFLPLNQWRGLGRVMSGTLWQPRVRAKNPIGRAKLLARTSPQNLIDGFQDTAWVSQKRLGVGDWIKIELKRPRPLLGVAIAAKASPTLRTLLKNDPYTKTLRPPFLKPPRRITIVLSKLHKKTYSFPLLPGKLNYFPLPKVHTVRTIRIEITKQYRDAQGKLRTIIVPKAETALGFLSEIIPIFDEYQFSASSSHRSSIEQYPPQNIHDRNPYTAWAEGHPDDGIHEWIQVHFPAPKTIRSISILNGCRKPGEPFTLHNRVKRAKISFSNGKHQTLTLKDTSKMQMIKIRPTRSSLIRLKIVSVYKGKIGHTTCISEFKAHP
ncbi:MAG: discoidin domain-containing protein, partial [Myxococcota bacterium]